MILFILEPSASGNSKSAILITSPPVQSETTAYNNYPEEIKETVNPASNQESKQSEVSHFESVLWIGILGGKNNGLKRM